MNQHFSFHYRRSFYRASVLIAAVAFFLGGTAFLAVRFPINQSASMPLGIYRLVSRPLARGVIVGACVSNPYASLARERGYLSFGVCDEWIHPVMKYVVAIEGDVVVVRPDGVSVNGAQLPNTPILRNDSLGRRLPNQLGKHILKRGEYWLASNRDPGSFDSRYFGPVTKLIGVVEPLLILEEDLKPRAEIDLKTLGATR